MQVIEPQSNIAFHILGWELETKKKYPICIKCKAYYADVTEKNICSYCALGLQ